MWAWIGLYSLVGLLFGVLYVWSKFNLPDDPPAVAIAILWPLALLVVVGALIDAIINWIASLLPEFK